jgi:hypothetical protein
MTVFPLSKWAIKKIDKIKRNFLWHGSEETRKGYCMVNWRRVQMLKKLGGIGITDLVKFNRALRLRWQWYQWNGRSKPWVQLPVMANAEEQALFQACTIITFGDGAKIKFWHDRWLHNQSPREVAPGMYRLVWRKTSP